MARIRGVYIQKRVFDFYQKLDSSLLKLPFDILSALKTQSHIKFLTYSEYSKCIGVSTSDLVKYSNDGSVHKLDSECYVILYNECVCEGRMRFTVAHELGHITLDHLTTLALYKESRQELCEEGAKLMEREADWFASMILCPFPVLRKIGIESPSQIKKICNLSTQASIIKFEQYTEWCQYHQKTLWENKIIKLFEAYIQNFSQVSFTDHAYPHATEKEKDRTILSIDDVHTLNLLNRKK